VRLPQPALRQAVVPKAKAWAALLVTCAGASLAATVYLDPGPTRVLAPALLAAVVTVGLWRPARYVGPAAAALATACYALTLATVSRVEAGGLSSIAFAVATAGLGLFGSGVVADLLAARTERDDRRRRLDARIIEELTPTLGGTDVMKREHGDRALREEIDRARRYGHSVCLALLGMRGEEQSTEAQGLEAAGEQQLRLATAIRALVRTTDRVIISRPGEVTVLMPHTPLKGALTALDRLRLAVQDSVDTGCSVGVAEFPNDAADADELVNEAQHALDFARQAELEVASRDLLHGGRPPGQLP